MTPQSTASVELYCGLIGASPCLGRGPYSRCWSVRWGAVPGSSGAVSFGTLPRSIRGPWSLVLRPAPALLAPAASANGAHETVPVPSGRLSLRRR